MVLKAIGTSKLEVGKLVKNAIGKSLMDPMKLCVLSLDFEVLAKPASLEVECPCCDARKAIMSVSGCERR